LILQNTLYAVVYCTIVLTAAAAVFSRRNLKMKSRNSHRVAAVTGLPLGFAVVWRLQQ